MTKFLRILGSSPPLLALLFVLLGQSAHAQVDTYTFAASSSTFTPLSASATPVTSILADDALSGPISIFPFTFDGSVYTSVNASSNGFLSFAPSPNAAGLTVWQNDLAGTLNSTSNPPPSANRPLIAPLWEDLDGRTSGAEASWEITGTAPNRVFTFQWLNTNRYLNTNGPAAFSFQVKLYETTNVVQTVYRAENGATNGTLSASIGLAGAGIGTSEFLSLSNASSAPTTSSTVANNNISSFPATGQVYTFTPTPPAACPNARGVVITNITGTSAQLNFRNSASATAYTVTITPQGGNTTTQTVTTAPVNFTGLSVNTTYTVTVTPVCATGTATPVSTTFATSNGYCVTGSGNTVLGGSCGGNDVTAVSLIGTTLNATGLTCNSPVSGTAYTQYPSTSNLTGTLQQGSTYTVNVTTSGNSIISVWIDYNRNLEFEASEWTQVATSTTAGTAASVNITIPTGPNITTGPTGMRIRSRATLNPNGASDACTQFYSGETKDFTVNIAPAPACPAVLLSSLNASNVTTTTATLNFTPVAGGTGTYSVIYGPQGFNPAIPGAGIVTVNPTTSPVSITGLQSGTVYQFYVQRDCGSVGPSVLVGPATFTTTILNNDPCGATPLTLGLGGCVPFATTLVGATATTGIPAPTGCGVTTNIRDVWFTFTTSASGFGSTDARVVVTGAAGGLQVLSAPSCTGPFTAIRCIGGSATVAAPALDVTGLTPNTTYYIRAYAYSPGAALGAFNICVTPLPNCPTPTSVAVTNINKSGATLTWSSGTAPANSTYTITYGPPAFNPDQGGTSITNVVGTSYQLTGLNSLTSYDFYIRLNCGGINGNSNRVGPVGFQTLQDAPANDEPCTAQTLTPGALAVNGATIGATTSRQPGIALPGCAPAPAPNDVWYTITMPPAAVGTDSLVLTINNAAVGQVRVFTAASCSAGPFVQTNCFTATAANTGFPDPLSIGQLLPGATYYIAVSNYATSDSPGTFDIGANVIYVGPPCNPVTSLTAANITPNSAEIGFVPGAFNTSYTITYGPTNGTATTVTTTTPTLTSLTGLAAATQYTVTVNPVCANGGAASGTTTTFTTLPPVCDPVTNLMLSNFAIDSLRVTFTPGVGNTSYSVVYQPSGGTADTVTTTGSSVLLTNLIPSTLYTVTVTPLCAAGGATGGVFTTGTTLQPICNPVTNLVITNVTDNSLQVTFTAGTNNTSYVITYGPTNGSTTTLTTTGTSVSLVGLVPDTPYTITVTPQCLNGELAGDESVTTTTLAPICNSVTNVVVRNITSTSASVSFTPGRGNTSYTVTYSTSSGPPVGPITGTASPVVLTGLSGNTSYSVTVTPVCAAGGTATPTTTTFVTTLSTRTALGSGMVSVYPNPAHHTFTLSLPAIHDARTASVDVVNALGQVVSQRTLSLTPNGTGGRDGRGQSGCGGVLRCKCAPGAKPLMCASYWNKFFRYV